MGNPELAILLGFATGFLARLYLLRSDYRQYPSYPHGYASHLALGAIAAFIGAVVIPAVAAREYTAVTFLTLAAQQFREVRDMERKSLVSLEEVELVRRGNAYIEGIAKIFEARNYMVMAVAVLTSGGTRVVAPWLGVLLGAAGLGLAALLIDQEVVGDVARIRPGELRFDGPGLFVDDIFVMNVGLQQSRESILDYGLGAVLEPKDDDARDTLANAGQRQAILHDVSVVLGVRRDVDEPEFTPLIRRQVATGRVALYIVPMEKDMGSLLAAIGRVPVLESSRGRALKAKAGRLAAD
ncbi:MAG: YIEGIA family protein [Bacillota bacterium]